MTLKYDPKFKPLQLDLSGVLSTSAWLPTVPLATLVGCAALQQPAELLTEYKEQRRQSRLFKILGTA
ncbi:MAG: hypothetical protein SGJ20_21505, partial [Planctomycetota bacterium]|nr:hypothetical protein [Planctomycetota bacterium]